MTTTRKPTRVERECLEWAIDRVEGLISSMYVLQSVIDRLRAADWVAWDEARGGDYVTVVGYDAVGRQAPAGSR